MRQNVLKLAYGHLGFQKFSRGLYPRTPVQRVGEGRRGGGEAGQGRAGEEEGEEEKGREEGGRGTEPANIYDMFTPMVLGLLKVLFQLCG
jgi:hypothetical protein